MVAWVLQQWFSFMDSHVKMSNFRKNDDDSVI